jgi:RNA polymerase sigma-70 factor (ECF subfamily)
MMTTQTASAGSAGLMECSEVVWERTYKDPEVVDPRPRVQRKAIDPDAALVEQLRREDGGAAEALVGAYGSRVYRLAIRITGSAADAEEVVQDALWTVIRKIDTFRGDSAFGSWLYRIAANAAYQKVRGQRRRTMISLDDLLPAFHEDGKHAAPIVDWSTRVDDPSRQTELRRVLSAALDALPDDYRTAVILRDVEGFSTAELAETLGLSIANAKTRIHRARLFLRRRLTAALQ